MTYRDYEQDKWPPWDGRDDVLPLLAGHGIQKDGISDLAVDAVMSLYPEATDQWALNLLGREHNLRSYPGEYTQAYLARIRQAFEFWGMAGTNRGMLAALQHMGYGVRLTTLDGRIARGMFSTGPDGGVIVTQAAGEPVQPGTLIVEVDGETFEFQTLTIPSSFRYYELPPTRIIEHYTEDPTIWAEFSLFLTPSAPDLNADGWDDGSRWDDDTLWDLTIRQDEVDRIRAVVNEIKPAHARLRGIYLVPQWGQDYWDDDTTWDDGTIWDGQLPTVLYLREGA